MFVRRQRRYSKINRKRRRYRYSKCRWINSIASSKFTFFFRFFFCHFILCENCSLRFSRSNLTFSAIEVDLVDAIVLCHPMIFSIRLVLFFTVSLFFFSCVISFVFVFFFICCCFLVPLVWSIRFNSPASFITFSFVCFSRVQFSTLLSTSQSPPSPSLLLFDVVVIFLCLSHFFLSAAFAHCCCA